MRNPFGASGAAGIRAEMVNGVKPEGGKGSNRKETQEESLQALVEIRAKEVERLRKLISEYQIQLVQAEDRLWDAKSKLGSLLYEDNLGPADASLGKDQGNEEPRKEAVSSPPMGNDSMNGSSQPRPLHSRPEELQKDKVNPNSTRNNLGNYGAKMPNMRPEELQKDKANSISTSSILVSDQPRPLNSRAQEVQKQKSKCIPVTDSSTNTSSQPRPSNGRLSVYELVKKTFGAPITSEIAPGLKTVKEEVSGGETDGDVNGSRGTKRKFDPKEQFSPTSTPLESGARVTTTSKLGTSASFSTNLNSAKKFQVEKSHIKQKVDEIPAKEKEITAGLKGREELTELVHRCSKPNSFKFSEAVYVFTQHKRKLRTLGVCPMDDRLFATSSLDGTVKLWDIQGDGSSVSLISITDCVTPKRTWPNDMAWHPTSKSLFSVYSAGSDDHQVSVLNAASAEKGQVSFLDDKPHVKGTINAIKFMPWETACFATCGNDHAVVLWRESEGGSRWTPEVAHKILHSSSVMGVAGMPQKQVVISAGADRRVVAFNVVARQMEFTHQLESKCLDILPNPRDSNLYMVQTGAHGKQLRLYDVRSKRTEFQPFGWIQASSESQSSLVNQSWSPDGLYITSGSADPEIHIFDIRYKSDAPSQSIKAHQKRVFKAEWHPTLPLLLSISSDINIGLHKLL